MIQFFVKTNCPFSARARAALDAYKLSYKEKNVSDPKVVEELIALGGKKQEPFLVDGSTMMYESQAIIDYIERTYGGGDKPKPKIHYAKGSDVCSS